MRDRSRESGGGARPTVRKLRCAVYTRKSSEEGLAQDFNSLHAQREACESYIASQRHEGWTLIKAAYDDGGYSGGSMERPGLRKLLADVQSRLIDVVVVYKVDRLTRSLADFAKMVEAFDANGVSFVSVTQSFNTTTSMGRLTLNVLLSFAQFEREVTGERIRDKIAASKKKGMWMGGIVPMGYAADNRTLAIVEGDAAIILMIFERYLALGSVMKLSDELDQRGVYTNAFVSKTGKRWGGRSFSRGHLYKILSNPIYVGDIVHKGERYAGQHAAIVTRDMFDAVQARLADNGHERAISGRATEPALLAGLLFDDAGNKLFSSHANKGGKRYRYYVSRPKGVGSDNGRHAVTADVATKPQPIEPLSIPAGEIEQHVTDGLIARLSDQSWLTAEVMRSGASPLQFRQVAANAISVGSALSSTTHGQQRATLLSLIERITVRRDGLSIKLKRSAFDAAGNATDDLPPHEFKCADAAADDRDARCAPLTVDLPFRLEPKGREVRLIIPGGAPAATQRRLDKPLIKAVARGVTWYDDLAAGRVGSMRELATRENVGEAYVGQIIKLAFLAPDLIASILEGAAPIGVTIRDVSRGLDIPADWDLQRRSART